jgi:diguanylate cyclase (GGDEF)-like protein/PAS domain S-box-containing protein
MNNTTSFSARLIRLLERQTGWRLWLGFTLGCLVAVEVIVSIMDLLLKGAVTADYLLTGLVAAGLVAPVAVAGLTRLLEDTRQAKRDALELQKLRARKNMQVGLDAAQMLFWEIDLASGTLFFDDSRLHWLGLVAAADLHTLAGWLARVHPDDRAVFTQRYKRLDLQRVDSGVEYRFAAAPDHWLWYRTVARVAEREGPAQALLAAGCTINITAQKEATLALAASTQLLQTIIDTVPLRVFWKDRQLRYLGCNPVFARDAGFCDPQQIVGKDDSQLAWKGAAPGDAADDLAVIHSRMPRLSCVEQQDGPDGHQLWLRSSKVPLVGEDQETLGLLGVYEDVTAFKQTEQDLRNSEERAQRLATMLRLVSDNVPDMIWAKDLNQRFLFANKAMCEQLLGATSTDEPMGRDELFFARRARQGHPDDPLWHSFGETSQASDEEVLRLGSARQFEQSVRVRGRLMVLDIHKAPLLDECGRRIGLVGTAREVTVQKSAQDKLRLAALVLEHSSEAMMVTGADSRIVDINPAFSILTGYLRAEVIGKTPAVLKSGRQSAEFYRALWQALETRGCWQGELWNRRKDGSVFAEWLTINTIYHDDGSVHRRVALFSDVTEKKQAEEVIWKQANFDTLTGLPNRRMFLDRLGQDLLKSQRSGHRLALFFLDLDHFKEVNDSLGHEAGDLLLAEAARRISACLRASDTVARLGGDEFTVSLPDLDDPSRVPAIAGNIIESLSRPYLLGGRPAQVTSSVGISFYPDDATDVEALMERADQAMYDAKRCGRSQFRVFSPALQQQVQDHLVLSQALRQAMGNGQLDLNFLPVVALQTGRINKVEARLRWLHPQRGLIPAGELMALAQASGLSQALADWVFEQALEQSRRWSRRLGRPFRLALTLAPLQLLAWQLQHSSGREQLAAAASGGENFVIELADEASQACRPPARLQCPAGVAGASADPVVQADAAGGSFAALRSRPVDYFRIEPAMLRELAGQAPQAALAQAVVVLARQLRLKVIAEGVETRQQHELLRQMGCDFAQGPYYAQPQDADAIEHLIASCASLPALRSSSAGMLL